MGRLLREHLDLAPDLRVLEYGAGTGLLAQELAPHVGAVGLAEPSTGMREVIHAKVAAGDLPEVEVLDLDLTRNPPPEARYDLVVSLLVLHHIPELRPVLNGFAASLDAGGQVAIIDLDREDGSFHGEGFDGHHGFDHTWLGDQLTAVGFSPPTFHPAGETTKDGRTYPLFLASCTLGDDEVART